MKHIVLMTLLLAAAPLRAGVTVVVDRNTGDAATPQFRFEHVPRELNADADRLANVGVDTWLASRRR